LEEHELALQAGDEAKRLVVGSETVLLNEL